MEIKEKLVQKLTNLVAKVYNTRKECLFGDILIDFYCYRIRKNLNKITLNEEEQDKILDAIQEGNKDTSDMTYEPIYAKLKELGYKIVE